LSRRALTAVLASSAAVLVACGSATHDAAPLAGGLTLGEAQEFDEFPLVYAGEWVDGLPLVAIVRREDTANYVSFVYGDCRPLTPDGGCAPPAEVQVWPASRRDPSSYDAVRGRSPPELTRIRGSPAAFFDAGTRLEIYTAEVTIVVFARTPARLARIADALRCVAADAPVARSDGLAC
jgi:hypothetical protein